MTLYIRTGGKSGLGDGSVGRALATKPDDLSLIRDLHSGRRELVPKCCPAMPTCTLWHAHIHTLTK